MKLGDWDKPEVRNGIRRMLARRAELMEHGERTIGWKLGFGAPVWLERFGLSGPVVGYLSEGAKHPSGAMISCRNWDNPVAEPEIAVHLGRDIEDPARVVDAIAALGPAIELADVHPPPQDLEEVLAGNVFHRAVVLGEPDPGRAGGVLNGLHARITLDGSVIADTADLESLTGKLVPTLAHISALLAAAGERLRKGEVVILGSIIPPVPLRVGQEIVFELVPFPAISVGV